MGGGRDVILTLSFTLTLTLSSTRFVIASVAGQSRRRSNGGSSTYVQPRRGCHVAMLFAVKKWIRTSNPGSLEYPSCHCERSAAISSPEQRRLVDVCSTSSRLPRRYALRSKKVDTHEHPGSLEYPSCHCERSAAISSPEQRRLVDVCSTSSRLARRYAPRNDKGGTLGHPGRLTLRERESGPHLQDKEGWSGRGGSEDDAKGAVVGQGTPDQAWRVCSTGAVPRRCGASAHRSGPRRALTHRRGNAKPPPMQWPQSRHRPPR